MESLDTDSFPGFQTLLPSRPGLDRRLNLSRLQRRAPQPLQLNTSICGCKSAIKSNKEPPHMALEANREPNVASYFSNKDPIPLLSPLVLPSIVVSAFFASSIKHFPKLVLPLSSAGLRANPASGFLRNVVVSSELDADLSEDEGLDFSAGEEPRFSPDLKLFVGNLPFNVDSSELAGLFEQAGNVEMVDVIYDKATGKSRGFGFVTMSTVEELETVVQQFNGYELHGRSLRVNSGPPPSKSESSSFRGAKVVMGPSPDPGLGPLTAATAFIIGSLGSENSEEYVSDVVVNRAKLSGTTNGVRIKTWQGGSGSANNIKFHNIEMQGVKNSIIIDQSYCDQKEPRKEQSSAVQVKNIGHRNIKGTRNSDEGVNFKSSKSHPCQRITLQNVNLIGIGSEKSKAVCNNVRLQNLGTVSPNCRN
ncbi:pectin lyase-like superfamily protein [Striga asiatica]|uniref:Pectin lyase-like superfamily protein n=1 Tax=Striga asiatica TaxID=4170 RepID=A0A5A7PHU0_STRAF|nr:pectin lyase-like superfamily protein [Striga asiatica]